MFALHTESNGAPRHEHEAGQMQTPYQIGAGNAAEALDQAAYLMEREPDYYTSIEDVIESYATNLADTPISKSDWSEAERGFIHELRRAGIDHTPHGFHDWKI